MEKTKSQGNATVNTGQTYDYAQLAATPRLFAFFLGWFGQTLLSLTHVARMYGYTDRFESQWTLCYREACRVAVTLVAWGRTTQREIPTNLISDAKALLMEYGPAGYPASAQAMSEKMITFPDERYKHPEDGIKSLPGMYFPDILQQDDETTGRFGKLCRALSDLVIGTSKLIAEKTEFELGAVAAGLATGLSSRSLVIDSENLLESLKASGLATALQLSQFTIRPMPKTYELESAKMVVVGQTLQALGELFAGVPDEERDRIRKQLFILPQIVCQAVGVEAPPLIDLLDPPAFPEPPSLVLPPKHDGSCHVGSVRKKITVAQYDLLKQLQEAGPSGCKLVHLQQKHSGCRDTLKALRRDPDFASLIENAGKSHRGYRLLS